MACMRSIKVESFDGLVSGAEVDVNGQKLWALLKITVKNLTVKKYLKKYNVQKNFLKG